MSAELWILTATAVLAVVAICAAVIAVRAVRKVAANAPGATGHGEVASQAQSAPLTGAVVALRDGHDETAVVRAAASDISLEPRVVEGRLIVPPTQQQVVRTALGRPGVRLSIVVHGVAHALRAESRDRISALMRREFRRRRRERLQAGRRAVRASRPSGSSDQWLSS